MRNILPKGVTSLQYTERTNKQFVTVSGKTNLIAQKLKSLFYIYFDSAFTAEYNGSNSAAIGPTVAKLHTTKPPIITVAITEKIAF